VLDAFASPNGPLSAAWSNPGNGFYVSNQQLRVNTGEPYLVWNTPFGTAQEAFVTMNAVDANASELDLVLKAQGPNWSDGALMLYYYPAGHMAQIWTYSPGQSWQQHGPNYVLNLQAGDVFGGRIYTGGLVEMYRNGIVIASINVSSWLDTAKPGRAGVWVVNGPNTIMDNFGAGAVTNCNRTLNTTEIVMGETMPSVVPVGIQTHTIAVATGARLTWSTHRTAPITRFEVWRSQNGDQTSAVLANTVELTGAPALHGTYSYEDTAGAASAYWLQVVYADGHQEEIGPIIPGSLLSQNLYLPLIFK